MDGGLVRDIPDLCFWQIMDLDSLNNSDTFVYLEGNVAPVTGYAIYAGYTKDCIVQSASEEQKTSEELSNISRAIFLHVFLFAYLNISLSYWYRVSSQAATVCFCYQGQELICDEPVMPSISVYPGQAFKVLAVGMGVGISPAVVRSRISGKYNIFPKLQSLGNACEPLN